jgi:hypothetical protein
MSADTSERHALTGELGRAWLEHYDIDDDEEALRIGIAYLRDAIANAAEHPHRMRWLFHLGLGHAERGQRRQSAVDYHEAINWLSALYAGSPSECPERPRALAILGELCWERYWVVRHVDGVDAERAVAEVDHLLARMEGFLAGPPDPDDLGAIRLVVGYAYLERYELTADQASLERGIRLLAAASIWDLSPSDPRRCQAGSELTDALRQQSLFDENVDTLDRAVAAGLRTLEGGSPSDGTAWFLLHRYSASAAYNRYRVRGAIEDLDLAYRCWQPILHVGMDPDSANEYEQVLRDRAALAPTEPPPWL